MVRTHVLFAIVLATSPLASACGGSGGAPAAVTITILGEGSLDGFVRSDGAANTGSSIPGTGDVDGAVGVVVRQFFSFSLAAIPPGTTVASVALEITQVDVIGTPYATHGVVNLDHVDYGATLEGGDYDSAPLAGAFAQAAADASLVTKSIDVTLRVVADLGAARPNSQYRLRFSILDSDGDGGADIALWADGERSFGSPAGTEPQLIVTYFP